MNGNGGGGGSSSNSIVTVISFFHGWDLLAYLWMWYLQHLNCFGKAFGSNQTGEKRDIEASSYRHITSTRLCRRRYEGEEERTGTQVLVALVHHPSFFQRPRRNNIIATAASNHRPIATRHRLQQDRSEPRVREAGISPPSLPPVLHSASRSLSCHMPHATFCTYIFVSSGTALLTCSIG